MNRDKSRVANRFGRCFHHRKERFELENLKPADHIVEERHSTYWHHMIVESIDLNEKEPINVIHYYRGSWLSGSGSVVCRDSFPYTPDKFYRIVYEDHECLPASKVLEKAGARVDKKEPAYCLFTNNCEHFANECKTGKKKCYQKQTPIEILVKSATSTCLSSLVESLRSRGGWIKESDIEKGMEFGAKVSPTFAIILASIIEIWYLSFHDYSDAKTKFDKGKLNREEFREVIVKRVCAAFLSIWGNWIVFVYGEIKLLPRPTFLGRWVLPILGIIVAGAAIDYLVKELTGVIVAFLAEYIDENSKQSKKKSM